MVRSAIAAGYFRLWPGLGVLLLAVCSSGIQVSYAADSDIYRVEEDWELVVNEPDSSIHSPQITFFIAPDDAISNRYFQLQLNHAVEHDFSGGGFHVAAVHGTEHLDCVRSNTYQSLVSDAQSVSWTNVMAIGEGGLFFAIKDGYCTDWGAFGGPESLVQMPANDTTNFNAYTPDDSLEMVDVGFGGNRIASLVLKNVRLYYADGRVSQVTVNRSPY